MFVCIVLPVANRVLRDHDARLGVVGEHAKTRRESQNGLSSSSIGIMPSGCCSSASSSRTRWASWGESGCPRGKTCMPRRCNL